MYSLQLQTPGGMEHLPTMLLHTPQLHAFTYSFDATQPPPTDAATIMPRVEEVNTIQQMLSNPRTNAVVLVGEPGSGKTTLAALLYRRLQTEIQSPPRLIWLTLGTYTTLPDILAAIISNINKSHDPAFFLLSPEQQITFLQQTLLRSQEQTLVVLDGFDELSGEENTDGMTDRGAISCFLTMLQTDLGSTRFLLTSYISPYGTQLPQHSRVQSYTVSRLSLSEATALLDHYQVHGSEQELALAWQRCRGHAFTLILFSALIRLSRFSLSYLLHSSDYKHLWNNEVTTHLLVELYTQFNAAQQTLLRALCLFNEPAPLQAILAVLQDGKSILDSSAIEHELELLAQLSLIQLVFDSRNEPRYLLHVLLHQYVIEHYLEGVEQTQKKMFVTALGVTGAISARMQDTEDAQHIALASGHLRVAAYYRQLANQNYRPIEKRRGPQDIEFLLTTIRYLCLGLHGQEACDLLFNERIHESMLEWGVHNTMICLYKTLIPPSGVLLRRDEGTIYNLLGMLYGRLGAYPQSMAYHEKALLLQRSLGNKHDEAITLTNWGELFLILQEWDLARTQFEQALLLNQQLHDPEMEIVLLHNLGLLHHMMKEYVQTLSYYQYALRWAYSIEGQKKVDVILANIGVVLYEQGYQAEAVAIFLATLRHKALQPVTNNFIDAFLEELETRIGPQAFDALNQQARAIQGRVMAKLIGE
ncbi:MAG: tetratricopeptide repeat protein [Chloroflexota bacterium]|nr:tetratricopeptide repeat protein [Chloroflexota bacterium]